MITKFLTLSLVLLALAPPANAEVARVKSGEHADFTRLVIEAPGVKDWTFGRTDNGYALRLDSTNWDYDLSGVFDLIPRKRLASLDADPETGELRLAIACTCHAIPFEFRPGLIVVDLRGGPPPRGSSFEDSLEDSADARAKGSVRRPVQRPLDLEKDSPPQPEVEYSWLDDMSDRPRTETQPSSLLRLDAPSKGKSLDPLRQALLAQMSIGLSNGTIDLAEPGRKPPPASMPSDSNDWSRVVLGEVSQATANVGIQSVDPVISEGQDCIPDEALNLHEWGSDEDVFETFGEIRQGILGEFDRPDTEALQVAARELIYLGFGAEAGQLLKAFPPEQPEADRAVLLSLSQLVDGRTDPDGPFASMALCESTAALWAALSSEGELKPGTLNEASVRRGFSALPPHLRRALGPGLIERFLEADNDAAVIPLRDAIERGGHSEDPVISVLDAQIDLTGGHAETAEKRAIEVLTDPGPVTAEAVIALVEAQTSRNSLVDARTVTTVEALLEEQAGTTREPTLRRALVLARFGAGDVAGAFKALPDAPWATEEVWSLLAEHGGDSDILAQAVVSAREHPQVAPETANAIAKRLLGLGLAEPALQWLGEPRPEWTSAEHLIHGRALLALGEAEAAVATVSDQSDPDSAILLAEAMTALGEEGSAADAFKAAGAEDRAAAARSLAENWTALANASPEAWQTAAQRLSAGRVETIDPGNAGALGRGSSLLDNSQTDRASVTALLQAVPMPEAQP